MSGVSRTEWCHKSIIFHQFQTQSYPPVHLSLNTNVNQTMYSRISRTFVLIETSREDAIGAMLDLDF